MPKTSLPVLLNAYNAGKPQEERLEFNNVDNTEVINTLLQYAKAVPGTSVALEGDYPHEGTLLIRLASKLYISGPGKTFSRTNGTGDEQAIRNRAHWRIERSSGVELVGFEICGSHPNTGRANDSALDAQHCIHLQSSSDTNICGMKLNNQWGDHVNIGAAPRNNKAPSTDTTIVYTTFDRGGRCCVVPNACDGLVWRDSTIKTTAHPRSMLDAEAGQGYLIRNLWLENLTMLDPNGFTAHLHAGTPVDGFWLMNSYRQGYPIIVEAIPHPDKRHKNINILRNVHDVPQEKGNTKLSRVWRTDGFNSIGNEGPYYPTGTGYYDIRDSTNVTEADKYTAV